MALPIASSTSCYVTILLYYSLTGWGVNSVAPVEAGGWPDDVFGPSPIPFSDTYPEVKAMTVDQIKEAIAAFGAAARRAVEAGFDMIEIHGAHGYLFSNFMSPLSNVSQVSLCLQP